MDWDYWGKPVPGFGDPHAKLLILGLAPAAHGGNRTGRVFTGDRSGDFLYKALYETGFSNQPNSTHRGDGLKLKNVYIAATIRCAPPQNKPLPSELANCLPYFERELQADSAARDPCVGRHCVTHLLGTAQEKWADRWIRKVPASSRSELSVARRAATAICLLSSQPAEYIHRETHGTDDG